mmetsp:Transcript_17460/g.27191  ORF Transcript_17460/g.27191 Transcript_17460/m.27191 type:complete len:126 (-) Transcript_17460:1267-1644(-)
MRVHSSILSLILPFQGLTSSAFVVVSSHSHRLATTRTCTSAAATRNRSILHAASGGNNDDDPTKVWYAGVANAIQNVLTNSPLNEGKKALVKSLAGEYDVAAVKARLDGLIADSNSGVLMLSFVK